jgi:hypothetical protein
MYGLRFTNEIDGDEPSMRVEELRTFACSQCKRVQRHIIESTVTGA